MSKTNKIWPEKYRTRKGLFGVAVLQVLTKDGISYPEYYWEDVKYDRSPRALRSEIID